MTGENVLPLARLRTVRGHMDSVVRMAEDGRSCAEVLHQISAVQGALDGIRKAVLIQHLTRCVLAARSSLTLEEVMAEVVEVALGAVPRERTARQVAGS